MNLFHRIFRRLLARTGFTLLTNREKQRLRQNSRRGRQAVRALNLLQLLQQIQPAYAARALELTSQLHGQYAQDLVAALMRPTELGPGFYVEFGATDGVKLSNTLLLERLGWQGILAEPGRNWHTGLRANRSASISTDCVWRTSGEQLEFSQLAEPMLSGITSHNHRRQRRNRSVNATYHVNTISLQDLLLQGNAPRTIDFLSIDTEGSEHAILAAFPFAEWTIHFIAVEHNHRPDRADLEQLLGAHGFRPILREHSAVDDWYIHPSAYAQAEAVFRLS
jgi:FkbM family methyltransferase